MLPRSFLFVRHGETDWNRDGVLQGFNDIPLNDTGRAQARDAIPILKTQDIDRIVASPLSRARETADIINVALQKPLSFNAGIRERHFGDFEGKSTTEIDRLRHELHGSGAAVEENGYPCPPGAESYAVFKARIIEALHDELHTAPGQAVMFVCHGGVYRVLRRSLLGDIDHSPNVKPFLFAKSGENWVVRAVEAADQ